MGQGISYKFQNTESTSHEDSIKKRISSNFKKRKLKKQQTVKEERQAASQWIQMWSFRDETAAQKGLEVD